MYERRLSVLWYLNNYVRYTMEWLEFMEAVHVRFLSKCGPPSDLIHSQILSLHQHQAQPFEDYVLKVERPGLKSAAPLVTSIHR